MTSQEAKQQVDACERKLLAHMIICVVLQELSELLRFLLQLARLQ